MTTFDEMHKDDICDACGGTGTPISNKPCMCRGSGKMSVAALYLRERLVTVEQELERINEERIKWKTALYDTLKWVRRLLADEEWRGTSTSRIAAIKEVEKFITEQCRTIVFKKAG